MQSRDLFSNTAFKIINLSPLQLKVIIATTAINILKQIKRGKLGVNSEIYDNKCAKFGTSLLWLNKYLNGLAAIMFKGCFKLRLLLFLKQITEPQKLDTNAAHEIKFIA